MKDLKLYTIILNLIVITLGLNSCTNDDCDDINKTDVLRISTAIATRSVITGTSFNKGDSIGVSVLDINGNAYNTASTNIPVVYDGKNWNMKGDAIHLNSGDAKVYAYYPYSKSNSSKYVDVDMNTRNATGQTDYLYGSDSEIVNASNTEAKILFNFALARITLNITKSDVDKEENLILSRARLTNTNYGTAISVKGFMSVMDGNITKISQNTTDYVYVDKTSTLDVTTPTTVDLLVFPTTVENNVCLSLIINENAFSVNISDITWQAGHQYIYPITVNSTNPAKTFGNKQSNNDLQINVGEAKVIKF